MHKVIATIALLTLFTACTACNSHAYWKEAKQYSALANEALIARRICASPQDCQKKQLLFAEGGEFDVGFFQWGGAYITLYDTQDAELVSDLESKFKLLHRQLGKPQVTLTVYSSKHLAPKVKFREIVLK